MHDMTYAQKKLRAVYQERLVFYYFKNSIKRYPKNGENAYLAMKNQRASRALRWALECWQNGQKFFGPPPLTKSWIHPSSTGAYVCDVVPFKVPVSKCIRCISLPYLPVSNIYHFLWTQ